MLHYWNSYDEHLLALKKLRVATVTLIATSILSCLWNCLPSTLISRLLHALHLLVLIDKRPCSESAKNYSGEE